MKKSKVKKFKAFGLFVIVVIAVLFVTNSTKLLKKPSATFVVEKGSISYEESATGYVIRDEVVLEENNSENRNGTDKI